MAIDKTDAEILNRVTQILRSGSGEDIKRLRQYLVKFKLREDSASSDKRGDLSRWLLLGKRLRKAKSDSDAMRMILAEAPTRDQLVFIARDIGVPVQKSDRIEQIREKIVHETVSSRLNSEAIRKRHS